MSKILLDVMPKEDSFNSNIHSGIIRHDIETNLPKDVFLRILCLENKIEKKYTIQHMDNLIVLYSQLVEHYNMKRDPIYIYFLERIKNYLAKTNSLKLYYKGAEKDMIEKQNTTWIHESDDSILYSDEDRERSPHKLLRDNSSQNPVLPVVSPLPRKDSFENLLEQKRKRLRKSISFLNYQQAKKFQLQEEIYDLERKKIERNLKLSVFKEVFMNQENKTKEVKEIIKNYEELSREKDDIVKSDIESQMNSIQQRIQIKSILFLFFLLVLRKCYKSRYQFYRNNQFKKSLTIELNTPRSNREYKEEPNLKISYIPSNSTKHEGSQQNYEFIMHSPQPRSAKQFDSSIQMLSPSDKVYSCQNVFSSSQAQTQQPQKFNLANKEEKKAILNIKNFHQKLGIVKSEHENQQQFNNGEEYNGNGSYSSDELQYQVNSIEENHVQPTHENESKNMPSLIKEVASQEHSFSNKESISPSKYVKDFGYDNE